MTSSVEPEHLAQCVRCSKRFRYFYTEIVCARCLGKDYATPRPWKVQRSVTGIDSLGTEKHTVFIVSVPTGRIVADVGCHYDDLDKAEADARFIVACCQ